MRLLHARTRTLQDFYGRDIPPYTILSHRWEGEEVTFQDLRDGWEDGEQIGRGYEKIQGCCARAMMDVLDCVIDSCCIDKSSSAELSETINSMFHCCASKRQTTRKEDQAYCLMGLFNVSMPPLYGEGRKAFIRLQLEIIKQTDDESIFAWAPYSELFAEMGMLAPSPAYFELSSYVTKSVFDEHRPPHTTISKGLRLEFLSIPKSDLRNQRAEVIIPLNCTDGTSDNQLALYLWDQYSPDRSHARSSDMHSISTSWLLRNKQSLQRDVFFVPQSNLESNLIIPQKVLFNAQCLIDAGFTISRSAASGWAARRNLEDPERPYLHRFKSY
ncbi:hypothetical protein G7Y89_g2394 [Cudoniella acicularis]|uniref:Uncharacterized protein n=1 Tax=Cudoniella acicularis TaxID=354080 RepID=A0A8H4RUI3_9HELO|nr:hypothetical protein G7Y89_g2394 [Cudoniella acicularis]